MAYVITKDFHLSYSHTLDGLPLGHQCARLHGHNAVIRVELAAVELDDVGFVLDYGDLSMLGRWLDDEFDHRHLNDRLDFNPTAEHLAEHVYRYCYTELLLPVVRVGWSETPKTWAYYSEGIPT